MAATNPSETLERLHLKLAMSESDGQLQTFTDNHLVDIIRIAGTNSALFEKVREILAHYNRRVRNNEVISFPVAPLIAALHSYGPLATNLALVYLRFAKARLTSDRQLELLPVYIGEINRRSADKMHCFELLSLAMPGLLVLSKMDKPKWPELSISKESEETVLTFFKAVLVFNTTNKEAMQATMSMLSPGNVASNQPAISACDYVMVAKNVITETTSATEYKTAIIRLLSAGLFSETPSFPLLVLASAMNINAVDDAAESALKKVDIQKCVDSKTVVEDLMYAYLGSAAASPVKMPLSQQVAPANMLMKCKILQFLSRSTVAPTSYMNNVKICLDGMTQCSYPKLHAAALGFLLTVIEKMPAAARSSLAPIIFSRLKALLMDVENAHCACLVHRCLGALGRAEPSLVFADLSVVVEMFASIPASGEDVAYAAVDCLVAWLPAFCQSKDQNLLTKLKELVGTYVTHENAKCRLVALKYVEALLSSAEMDIKWMLLVASGDSRDEMRRESARLLELSLRSAVPTVQFAVTYLWEKLHLDILAANEKEVPNTQQSLPAEAYQMCCRYLWAVCESESGGVPELSIVEGDDHWLTASPKIAQMLRTFPDDVTVKMTRIGLHAIKQSQDVHLFRIAACFSSVKPVFDMPIAMAACLQRVRGSTRGELSSCISYIIGLLMKEEERQTTLEQAMTELAKSVLAGICWLAASLATAGNDIARSKTLLARLVELAEEGYERPSSVLEAALGAMGVILARYHKDAQDLALNEGDITRIITICEKIAASRKDTLAMRARESAASAIGLLVSDIDVPHSQKVVDSLYAIGEGPPQPELQLTVGAAIWDACLGQNSASRRQVYVVAEDEVKLSLLSNEMREQCESRLSAVLLNILDKQLVAANHHLRRAALVWLLVLVQKGGAAGSSSLAGLFDRIQEGFADGLTENDDFTQDIASKGMGIVYQMAGADQRKSLVAGLMTSLVEGRKSATKVQGDTVLFKEGQLGKSPDGSNLTTYKELCSLATDLNQPDLVYKFMQLAKHNASWNAKKGAAFGFGAILEQAREELDPFVGQLVPKLFRYRYDPDMKVQQSMRSIWTILTQSRRNVVDEYADEIAKELIPQLTNREWRVRESACLALSDLLRGHDTSYMHSRVPDLIEIIFRVKDDVKESVRLAADRAAESIRKLIVKLASSTNREKSDSFITLVLPVIIEKGVHSSIKAIQGFSLGLLIELSKSAAAQLRPYLAELIPCLLDAISGCESSVLNYLAVRSSTTQLEALDDARAQMARTSPMMTAIHDLLPQIDQAALVAMQPRVCEQLRASVGMSTRAAAAQLITQLSLRAPQLMMDSQPICDKFFYALLPGVRDRNPSIRKNFANSLSYLAKFASPNQMKGLVKSIAKDLVSEHEDMKESSRHVIKNLLANCPEVVKGYDSDIVPYVFLETCMEVIKGDDASKKRHAEWSELWSDLVPSTSAAVRLYRKEILALAADNLQNNAVWAVRAQSGRMLARTVEAIGDGLEAEEADALVTLILPLLSGRLWTGKAQILSSLAAVINSTDNRLKETWSEERKQEVFAVIKREASKRNKDYSSAGMEVCAVFAHRLAHREAADWMGERVQTTVNNSLNPSKGGSSSDDDSLTNLDKEAISARVVGAHLVALTRALPAYRDGLSAAAAVTQVSAHLGNESLYWKARQDMLVALLDTVTCWQLSTPLHSNKLTASLLKVADEMCEAQRKTVAAQSLQVVMKMAERRDVFKVNWVELSKKLKESKAANETGLTDRLETAIGK